MKKHFCEKKSERVMSLMRKAYKILPLIVGILLMADSIVIAKTLQIAVGKWPPYDDIGNEKAPGYSTEIAKHVFKIMGTEAEFREIPWKRAQQLVFDGERDALHSAFLNEERAKHCFYPEEPLGTAKYVLFIQSKDVGRLVFNSYQDLQGKRIGVQTGASYTQEFQDFLKKSGSSEEVPENELNFKKLAAGRVDYVVAEHGNGIFLIKQLGLSDKIVPLLAKSVKEDKIYLIFSRKNTDADFVKKFSETLKAFKSTDDYKAIYKKYFELDQK